MTGSLLTRGRGTAAPGRQSRRCRGLIADPWVPLGPRALMHACRPGFCTGSTQLAEARSSSNTSYRRRLSCPRPPPPPNAPAPFPGRRTCPATFVRATPRSATSGCITSRPARGRWSSCCTAFPSSGTAGGGRSSRSRRRDSASSPPTCAATTCHRGRTASRPTTSAR